MRRSISLAAILTILTILRQVRPRVLTGIRFRIGGVGAVPRDEAYSNISSTVDFVCLGR